MSQQLRTQQQQEVINALVSRFEIDAEGIRFLNPDKRDEPWFPAEVLQSIARQSERFRGIAVEFATYIEPLKQVVYVATVTDNDNRIFTRSGAAGLNEYVPEDSEVTTQTSRDARVRVPGSFDPHALAASRSITAALTAAGFNPVKAASAVPLDVRLPSSGAAQLREDQRQSQLDDVRTIHILAKHKGLIKSRAGAADDRTEYVLFLEENFGVSTSVKLENAADRAACISALRALPDPAEVEGSEAS